MEKIGARNAAHMMRIVLRGAYKSAPAKPPEPAT
jgi:hypothetical protein